MIDATVGGGTRREALHRIAREALGDPVQFSKLVLRRPLYAYQREAIRGIVPHLTGLDDPQFVVMMARQAGKNELSAHFEAWMLNRHRLSGGTAVKAAPTMKPQTIISMLRCAGALNNWWNRRQWKKSFGYIITLGNASIHFFSADPQANVVGATASLFMEADEGQDIDGVEFEKRFSPMRATTNAPLIVYGTAWTKDTFLQLRINECHELERRDGIRRTFFYDWEKVAEINPKYGVFVRGRIAKLGADHPIVLTQYRLKTIDAKGAFLTDEQRRRCFGAHHRMARPTNQPFTYVAGIDIGGAAEEEEEDILTESPPKRDSTVVTIGRIDWSSVGDDVPYPRVQVVDHRAWIGTRHESLLNELCRYLTAWNVTAVTADAGGVGAGITDMLQTRLGGMVEAYKPNGPNKTELGYEFMAAINTDRFKLYRDDGSDDWKETVFQLEQATREMYANQQMRWFVPSHIGHDDYLLSAAFCVWAARTVPIPVERRDVDLFPRRRV